MNNFHSELLVLELLIKLLHCHDCCLICKYNLVCPRIYMILSTAFYAANYAGLNEALEAGFVSYVT